jgi:hypothetical protein
LDRSGRFSGGFGDLLLRGFVAGIDFGGMEELSQRALLVAGPEQLAPLVMCMEEAV